MRNTATALAVSLLAIGCATTIPDGTTPTTASANRDDCYWSMAITEAFYKKVGSYLDECERNPSRTNPSCTVGMEAAVRMDLVHYSKQVERCLHAGIVNPKMNAQQQAALTEKRAVQLDRITEGLRRRPMSEPNSQRNGEAHAGESKVQA